jgi:hypothetical protein
MAHHRGRAEVIGFYLHAALMDQGTIVELRVGIGSRANHRMRGAITFSRDEWEAFRPIVVHGMRAASFLRTPVEFMDQTRNKPLEIVN